MSVTINIHRTHRQFTGGADAVEVEGKSVGECLDALVNEFPHMEEALFEKKGKLKNTIEIYVNQESAYPDELRKAVRDGDEVHIIVMLAGG